MVSGFFTSPYDHERTLSGDANRMRIASNDMPSGCFSNTVVIPSNVLPPLHPPAPDTPRRVPSRTIRLQRPDLHLAQPLAAKLGFAAQRLLGHQRIRPDGTGVDLIVHQMVELEHIHVPNCDRASERLAGPAVVKKALSGFWQLRLFQQRLDLRFRRALE